MTRAELNKEFYTAVIGLQVTSIVTVGALAAAWTPATLTLAAGSVLVAVGFGVIGLKSAERNDQFAVQSRSNALSLAHN